MKYFAIFLIYLFSVLHASSQSYNAEKLGYPKAAKLLIIHADDAGLAHAVNSATIQAFEHQDISSSSIQVPCPWFPEIAAYAKAHPELDWGIHLTLTAEWNDFKWGSVLPSDQVPSLLDSNGFFYASVQEFAAHAKVSEVEAELRAQIRRAMRFGIRISHLDSHMGALYFKPEYLEIFKKLAREFGLPEFQAATFLKTNNTSAADWSLRYNNIIQNLQPGLNELIVHLAEDNQEMQAVTTGHPDFGSAWRQNDFNYIHSLQFRDELKKNNIIVVNWTDIQKRLAMHKL